MNTDIIKLGDKEVILIKDYKSIYKNLKKINNSTFGKIYKVKEIESGKLFVIKAIIVTNKKDAICVENEYDVTVAVSKGRNDIVKCYKLFATQKKEVYYYCLLLEYIHGEDLCDFLCEKNNISHDFLPNVIFWLINVIEYLHSIGYTHRDLKIENIMIDEKNKRFVLIDFGLSTYIYKYVPKCDVCGTPMYISPELWKMSRVVNITGDVMLSSDIWAIGIILYIIITKKSPYMHSESDVIELGKEIVEKEHFIIPIEDEKIINIVQLCLTYSYIIRPNAKNIKDIVNKYISEPNTPLNFYTDEKNTEILENLENLENLEKSVNLKETKNTLFKKFKNFIIEIK